MCLLVNFTELLFESDCKLGTCIQSILSECPKELILSENTAVENQDCKRKVYLKGF